MIATQIFHDTMLNPRHLDQSSVDWFHPIVTQHTLDLVDTRAVKFRIYRSRRLKMSDWFQTGRFSAVDMSIFLHNAGDAISGCVRIYAWKRRNLKPFVNDLDVNIVRYTKIGNEDFYDFKPINYTENANVAMFNLKVDDTWDDFQVFVAQPCSAVSVYLNPQETGYPENYIKTSGSDPNVVLDLPIQDDFLGDNYDWETP